MNVNDRDDGFGEWEDSECDCILTPPYDVGEMAFRCQNWDKCYESAKRDPEFLKHWPKEVEQEDDGGNIQQCEGSC